MSAGGKPKGPFAVYVYGHVGFTFEGKLARLTDARQHARALLRRPGYSSRFHAVIANEHGHRETLTHTEANQ